MKLPKVLFLFLAAAHYSICPGSLEAQFYAPDTEYHDPVQRVAVVEMARVLAWLVNLKEPVITEISYQVTTKPDQSTTWDIRWLNAAGKATKSATVSYPAATLKEGPEFYRSIFKQLWIAGWKSLPAMKAGEVSEQFWQGASQMGLSREESLDRAFKLVSKEAANSEQQWVPRLSGLLVHTSLPAMSDRLTLDGVVLARGAAWLALAENASSSKLDGLWATVLFQAGRESFAARLWQKEFPAKFVHPTSEQAGWNIWLRKPTSKEVFLFASESTNLPIALPMLAYDVTVNQTGRLLAEVITELVPSPKDSIRLHNYAPLLAERSSIGGGHLMNGAWPVYGRAHWIRLLSDYPASSMDYTGYADSSASITNSLFRQSQPDPELDASLTGFADAAPLLRLAHKEGVGLLAPASVATARDLLNYGWEMAALQMGARHHFVAHRWGVRSQAEPIFKSVTTELEGVMPFFLKSQEAKTYNYKESLVRLQMADGFFQRVGWNPHPFDTKGSDLDSARLFVKRSWLRPRDFEWQARTLWDAKGVADIPELANALREEGGCHAAVHILNYLVSLRANFQREIPGADDLKLALAETLPQPSSLYVQAVYDRRFKILDNFERAQTIERLYWQNPDSGLEDRVFRNYVVVNALTSAKRFYTQARQNILDPVGFSNGMGKTAYMVGYVLNDPGVRKMALEDSRSGSHSDMIINIWDAAVKDNLKELEQTVHELVDRYEEDKGANSEGRRLLKFLPLLPALRDPRNSSRQEALRFFGKSESWIALRWIWIEKFKMPAEDAIALLGGRENDLFRRVLICYLEKDPAKTLEALNAFSTSRTYIDEKTALSTYLYYSLRKDLPKRDESDLKPAGVVSTRQAVLAKLKSKGN